MSVSVQKLTAYASKHAPTWCPGCGNFSIWISVKKALEKLGIPPHKALLVYGVGCSGNMSNTIRAYGWHSLHGRAVPTAVGAKLANKDLTVIVAAGDGDALGEGLSHFIHAIRGNVDITYLVHDNGVYGLTTGQAAPTASKGFKAKSTPDGLIDEPINPIALALTAGASFAGRSFSGNTEELTDIIVQGIQHPGLAFIDILQPCTTFNKLNTYSYYYDRVYSLQKEAGYTATDRAAALAKAFEQDKFPTGIFYQDAKRKSYLDELGYLGSRALVKHAPLRTSLPKLYREFM